MQNLWVSANPLGVSRATSLLTRLDINHGPVGECQICLHPQLSRTKMLSGTLETSSTIPWVHCTLTWSQDTGHAYRSRECLELPPTVFPSSSLDKVGNSKKLISAETWHLQQIGKPLDHSMNTSWDCSWHRPTDWKRTACSGPTDGGRFRSVHAWPEPAKAIFVLAGRQELVYSQSRNFLWDTALRKSTAKQEFTVITVSASG